MKNANYLIKLNVSITLYEYCTHNLAPTMLINSRTNTHDMCAEVNEAL